MTSQLSLDQLIGNNIPDEYSSYEEYELSSFEDTCTLMDMAIDITNENIPYTVACMEGTIIDNTVVQFEGIADVGKTIAKGFLKVVGFIAKMLYRIGSIIVAPFILIVQKIKGKSFKDTIKSIKDNWSKIDKKIDGWIPVKWNKSDSDKADAVIEASIQQLNDQTANLHKFLGNISATIDDVDTDADKRETELTEMLQKYKEKITADIKEQNTNIREQINLLLEWGAQLDENKLKKQGNDAKKIAKQLESIAKESERDGDKIDPNRKKALQKLLARLRKQTSETMTLVVAKTKENVNMVKNAVAAQNSVNGGTPAAEQNT
jgi:hypothetical protein